MRTHKRSFDIRHQVVCMWSFCSKFYLWWDTHQLILFSDMSFPFMLSHEVLSIRSTCLEPWPKIPSNFFLFLGIRVNRIDYFSIWWLTYINLVIKVIYALIGWLDCKILVVTLPFCSKHPSICTKAFLRKRLTNSMDACIFALFVIPQLVHRRSIFMFS